MKKVLVISILLIFSYSAYPKEGEFLINKRSSIYDSNDNLIVDLKKGDSVCLCNKPNHSDTEFSTYESVCDLNNNVIGSIYGGTYSNNIGKKNSNKCSVTYKVVTKEEKIDTLKPISKPEF